MKKALLVLVLLASSVYAESDHWNQNYKVNASKNTVTTSTITWRPVDNVQAVCEAESRKRGNKGFGYNLNACAFWDKNVCTVITEKRTTLPVLGHEMLHCFQGEFH